MGECLTPERWCNCDNCLIKNVYYVEFLVSTGIKDYTLTCFDIPFFGCHGWMDKKELIEKFTKKTNGKAIIKYLGKL